MSILAPTMYPVTSKFSLMNFPCKARETTSSCRDRRGGRAARPPPRYPRLENRLTKREELSFLMVLAFPKASRMGLACSSCFSSSPYGPKRQPSNAAPEELP